MSACVYVPVTSNVTSVGLSQLLCQLPVIQCHPNQIDRGRHSATGPKFPIPFPHIHHSVYVNIFFLSFCSLSLFDCHVLSAFHSLANTKEPQTIGGITVIVSVYLRSQTAILTFVILQPCIISSKTRPVSHM